MVYYLSRVNEGLISCHSKGDGYTITLKWSSAYPSSSTNKVAYHIYMSTDESKVFSEGVKYVVDGYTQADIIDLNPGQLYHFAVRAVEYNPNIVSINSLPVAYNNLKVYPNSLLRNNISSSDTIIPLVDVTGFPSYGIIQVGVEFINYLSVDTFNNNLVLTNASLQRGYLNTKATIHNIDGYDGYVTWTPPYCSYILGREEMNTRIFPCQNRFDINNYQYTVTDGYHQVIKDLLTSDLSGSDEYNKDFNSYDYAGWHRTDPVQLLNGECVGSYIGGEQFCADGYETVGSVIRGMSLQEHNNQRQELLLSITGEPVVLIKRMRTGITCDCFTPGQEYPDDRCEKCHGTKFVIGYEQYFNPRRSDGRIMVRFSPADEDLKMQEAGLESDLQADVWTLTVPTIKDRDILVRFDQDDNEEFRYEVLSVNRNKTISRLQGGQKLRVQRIRKFDPAYQIRVFRNTEMFPKVISTGMSSVNGIPLHSHTLTINEKITSITQINQTTGISFGHTHSVINGVVQPALGHTHNIII
jgi:hypothetical protein